MPTKSICLFYIVLVGLLSVTPARAEWLREVQSKMGTQVTVTFWLDDTSPMGVERGHDVMRLSMAEFDRIENAGRNSVRTHRSERNILRQAARDGRHGD